MRLLLFIFFMLPGVAFAFTGNFSYNGITRIDRGGDNFRMGGFTNVDKQGQIIVSRSSVEVDGKRFALRSTEDRRTFKIKGGLMKLVYHKNELIAVRIAQYNSVCHYNIVERKPRVPTVLLKESKSDGKW